MSSHHYLPSKNGEDMDYLNPLHGLDKTMNSQLSTKKRWKQVHRRRMLNISKSKLDPEIWEEFIRIAMATCFLTSLKSWNDYLSLLMVSHSTYRVMFPQYLRDIQRRPFYRFWYSLYPGTCGILPPSLAQKHKIAVRSQRPSVGLVIENLSTSSVSRAQNEFIDFINGRSKYA